MPALAPKPRNEVVPVPKSPEPLLSRESHEAVIAATEQIAADYAERIMQLRADPSSGPTVHQLIDGVPAALVDLRQPQPAA